MDDNIKQKLQKLIVIFNSKAIKVKLGSSIEI